MPSVPGCLGNQVKDQNTGRKRLGTVEALSRAGGQASSTLPPASSAGRAAAQSAAITMPSGTVVDVAAG